MRNIKTWSIDMILTDIPYWEVSKNWEARAKYEWQLRNIDKSHADILDFNLREFLQECSRIAKWWIYIFCWIEQVWEIHWYFKNHKDFMVRQCWWRKSNPSPANWQHMWLSSFENCIFAKRRKTNFYQSCKNAIWEFPSWRSKVHPTEKPLKLFEYLVESSSSEWDLILDPCAWSGTAWVACQNLNRNYILIEREEEYISIIENRLK